MKNKENKEKKEVGISEYWVNKKIGDNIELKICMDYIIFLRKGKEIHRLKSDEPVFRIKTAHAILIKNGYIKYRNGEDSTLEEEAVKLDKFLEKEVARGNIKIVKEEMIKGG